MPPRTPTQDDHARLFEAFDALCEIDGEDRRAHLEALRAEDADLADRVERLLRADDASGLSTQLAQGVAVAVEPRNPLLERLEAASQDDPVTVGELTVTARLGAGGMGAVFAARDRAGHRIAIKTLHRLSPNAIRRFKGEFRLVSRLVHPNLVTPQALIEQQGVWLLRMPRVDGVDWLSYVLAEGPGPGRLERLTDTLRQLCSGLAAVHAAQVLHLDIKPSNVLVDGTGRVRILDFGIAHATGQDGQSVAGVSGTPRFMAPEQFRPGAVTAAADTYALGVLIHRALTGRYPLDDTEAVDLADRKARLDPSTLTLPDDVPAHLSALCRDCLHPDPARRPDDASLAARLGVEVPESPPEGPFVGRAAELASLGAAWARARAGRTTGVRILGPSGIGKSRLCRRFVAGSDGAVVLRSRCHPHESIPFRALDGGLDDLADALVRWRLPTPPPTPVPLGPLLDAFPVLGQAVPPRAAGPTSLDAGAELAALFETVCASAPVVWWIDDAQWGDADSARLLTTLVLEAARLPLLIVMTVRDDGQPGPLVDGLEGTGLPTEVITVGPLDPASARQLADRCGAPPERVDAIAEAGAGVPFLVEDLARAGDLGDALDARLARLPPGVGDALRLLAVSGAPLTLDATLAATGDTTDPYELLATLEAARLARGESGVDGRVDFHHDRVRAAVDARIDPADREAMHLSLAQVLEARGEAPDTLARHYHGGGDRPRAGHWALEAAKRSRGARSFDHAAGRYADALSWLDPSDRALRLELLEGRAEMLGRASRSREAAAAWRAVAEACEAQRAPIALRRAVEHRFYGGESARALEEAEPLMRASGARLPGSPASALAGTLWQLAWLRLRGVGFDPRVPTGPDADRHDLRYALGRGISLGESVATGAVFLHCLREALRLGDPARVARALTHYGFMLSFSGQPAAAARGRGVFDRAEALALAHDRPDLVAQSQLFRGAGAVMRCRYAEGITAIDGALEQFATLGHDSTYERTIARMMQVMARILSGDLAGALRDARLWAADQDARGNVYGVASGRILASLAALALEDRDPRADCEAALASMDDGVPNDVLRSMSTIPLTFGYLYFGQGRAAMDLVEQSWGRFRRSGITMMQMARVALLGQRGRSALAAAIEDPSLASRARRIALAAARRLAREPGPHPQGEAALLRALCARGDRARLTHLEDARAAYHEGQLQMHAAAATWLHGRWIGGDAGAEARSEAEATLRRLGVARPEAWTYTLVPVAD